MRADASNASHSASSAWRWYRATAIAFALVFIIFALWFWWVTHFWPDASDFVSFWAAGRLALAGHPSLAYDIAAHHAAEQAVGHVRGILPFPYPPPFLAIATAFALLPFGPAFYLWIVATGGLFAWASRRVAPLVYAFAMPPAYVNLLIGQTGFLMSGIFIAGVTLIETSPWTAGAILGLMLFKPQLAILLPIAMLAGREWRTIAGAVVSASALLLAGLLLFGGSSYLAFLDILPRYLEFLRDGRLAWNELASPFALARSAGAPQNAALAIHAAIALVAALVTARAWWLKVESRVPTLAAATLLVPPYLFTYDALLLIVPLGWLIKNRRHPFAFATVWLCALLPILSYYSPVAIPNLIPIASLTCLWLLNFDGRTTRSAHEPSGTNRVAPAEVSPAS